MEKLAAGAHIRAAGHIGIWEAAAEHGAAQHV